jgi:hypothetical protein
LRGRRRAGGLVGRQALQVEIPVVPARVAVLFDPVERVEAIGRERRQTRESYLFLPGRRDRRLRALNVALIDLDPGMNANRRVDQAAREDAIDRCDGIPIRPVVELSTIAPPGADPPFGTIVTCSF